MNRALVIAHLSRALEHAVGASLRTIRMLRAAIARFVMKCELERFGVTV